MIIIQIVTYLIKNTEILPYPLCLGNISKDLSVDDMKTTGMFMFMICL